jgi:hypothetical protein
MSEPFFFEKGYNDQVSAWWSDKDLDGGLDHLFAVIAPDVVTRPASRFPQDASRPALSSSLRDLIAFGQCVHRFPATEDELQRCVGTHGIHLPLESLRLQSNGQVDPRPRQSHHSAQISDPSFQEIASKAAYRVQIVELIQRLDLAGLSSLFSLLQLQLELPDTLAARLGLGSQIAPSAASPCLTPRPPCPSAGSGAPSSRPSASELQREIGLGASWFEL